MVRVDPENLRLPTHPDHGKIIEAGKIICCQGIVIFPAQCLYGVAANALDPGAVRKVFEIKQRPLNNPILVLIHTRDDLKHLVKRIPDTAQLLMDRFWPGNLTLIFEAADHVSPLLTAGTGKIGIRIPAHPAARALVEKVKGPITGTSANLSGQPGCSRVDQLPAAIIHGADLILDAGPLKGGPGSSIVDVTTDPVRILRQGAVAAWQIHQALLS
ncbi:MAG: threonylcarbamoyl-AMP synthase [Proteobacteria bacterium]|nr:threonylcarbamoyl-AMP synthase [Desulfobacula sp.]MBU3953200.1 threonylcarbamoyl-AMP synthase [Pseudomonadota bacterium]MBU4131208.1 threonylcarbamoyl-AMP synthase [Pseudomonadota bacterium]